MVICASPQYVERQGRPVELGDFNHHSCITSWRRNGEPTWQFCDEDGRIYSQKINAHYKLSDGEAILDAALAGAGLCQLPTWLVKEHLNSGRLVPVLTDFKSAEMPINAIWPRSRFIPPRLRLLIDELVRIAVAQDSGFNS